MQKWLVGLIIDKVLGALIKMFQEWMEARQHKKQVNAKIKEIMADEKDPAKRAARIDQLLNS